MAMASLLLPIFILLLLCTIPCEPQSTRKELRRPEVNQENLTTPSTNYGRLNPSRVLQLSWRPRVFVYRGFISDEECDHLISLAREKKDGIIQESAESTTILARKDEIVARIEEKMSAWVFLPQENSRPLEVVHYGIEKAKQDYDFFGNKSGREVSEPLMVTLVLYLSDVSRGGGISFPESQLKGSGLKNKVWPFSNNHNNWLRPIKGNAILFFNAHPNASPDQSSVHVRHPVLEGEMWCATKLFHTKPISERKVENADCTDEHESCSKWAAIGECQRNPVYMIGSPDYYGTCRKSCNVC